MASTNNDKLQPQQVPPSSSRPQGMVPMESHNEACAIPGPGASTEVYVELALERLRARREAAKHLKKPLQQQTQQAHSNNSVPVWSQDPLVNTLAIYLIIRVLEEQQFTTPVNECLCALVKPALDRLDRLGELEASSANELVDLLKRDMRDYWAQTRSSSNDKNNTQQQQQQGTITNSIAPSEIPQHAAAAAAAAAIPNDQLPQPPQELSPVVVAATPVVVPTTQYTRRELFLALQQHLFVLHQRGDTSDAIPSSFVRTLGQIQIDDNDDEAEDLSTTTSGSSKAVRVHHKRRRKDNNKDQYYEDLAAECNARGTRKPIPEFVFVQVPNFVQDEIEAEEREEEQQEEVVETNQRKRRSVTLTCAR